ncbi:alpha/beta hydrolase [Anabaena sphaerica FACHB-251]|uniref:Alpha/beta hydrolase n=1 Tax=Anabaena sphaerica FACHB-251 TaxID=2692883 RepID=A0A927A3H9_9NOST|nr:alpha/beta hydrolase [Anabaena sphaerica]MBD2296166.1 alpha/beta hydrolase [Anabaena sphaerica FACHB-251]
MPIYDADPINYEGVNGHRYWCHEPFSYTGITDIDERLSGFPVAVFLPSHRPLQDTPLVIGLQGMCAPYQWNNFIIPTLTQMGIAVALFDTPFAGERSLVRTFKAVVENEIKPLIDRGISFDTQLLLTVFQQTALDITRIHQFCCEKYGISHRLGLFGVSMGVLFSAYTFTAHGIGERLLGTIGHADISAFANSWGRGFLPDLAASPLGTLAEIILAKVQPQIKPVVQMLTLANNLKYSDKYAQLCDPMTYIEQVQLPRRVRFLVGADDPIVNFKNAQACARCFPDGDCYVVPGLGHGNSNFGLKFTDHVRYFLATQLGDW